MVFRPWAVSLVRCFFILQAEYTRLLWRLPVSLFSKRTFFRRSLALEGREMNITLWITLESASMRFPEDTRSGENNT